MAHYQTDLALQRQAQARYLTGTKCNDVSESHPLWEALGQGIV